MFCVSCQATFSWRTGKVESGTTHNPHYFEWLRQRGSEVLRISGDPCEVVLNQAITELNGSVFKERNEYCLAIIEKFFINKVLSEINTAITRISVVIYNVDAINIHKKKLRLKYILGKDPEKTKKKNWFAAIKVMIKKYEMNKDCLGLLQTFERGLKDAVINSYKTRTLDYDELEKTIQSLDEYFSEQVREIKKRHGLEPQIKIVVPQGLITRWLN